MDTRTKLILAEWAYAPDPAALPPGLELLARSADKTSGYQGYAVGRRDPDEPRGFLEVVLINRGSDITTPESSTRETARDLLADYLVLEGGSAAHLRDAAAFYQKVDQAYGARSATPLQLTGHSLGGTCAYYQLAAAAQAERSRLPSVETFAALDARRAIARDFPALGPAPFAQALNHVRHNDPLVGPHPKLWMHALEQALDPAFRHGSPLPTRPSMQGLPQLGVNHVLPPDPAEPRHFLRPHDTPSLAQAFNDGERWTVLAGQPALVIEPPAAVQAATLQSSVASR
jgi:hypothetical protein